MKEVDVSLKDVNFPLKEVDFSLKDVDFPLKELDFSRLNYWIAYWDREGVKASGAEIWIANEIDSIPQCFSLTESDLTFYFQAFVKRRETFKEKFNI